MDRAYLLQHENALNEDVKVIGLYSSEASAKGAVERLRAQPGFSDYPDGFSIDLYELDEDHWSEGFVSG